MQVRRLLCEVGGRCHLGLVLVFLSQCLIGLSWVLCSGEGVDANMAWCSCAKVGYRISKALVRASEFFGAPARHRSQLNPSISKLPSAPHYNHRQRHFHTKRSIASNHNSAMV